MNLVTDLITLAGNVFPTPNFADKAATDGWLIKLVPDFTALAYDAGGFPQLQAECEVITPEQWEESHRRCAVNNPEKFGDGKILDILKQVDWAKLFSLVATFIAIFPKNPTPAPVIDGPVAK